MWFDGYHEQFGKRLEEFLSTVVPSVLSELSPIQRKQVTEGEKEFPFDAVLGVLNSKRDYEDKVSCILAIIGTWMNAASGSTWTLGPLSATAYAERVGIGIRWGEIAFAPLVNVAENLIDTYPIWPSVLMDFKHTQENDRDYFRQRLEESEAAHAVDPMSAPDKRQATDAKQ